MINESVASILDQWGICEGEMIPVPEHLKETLKGMLSDLDGPAARRLDVVLVPSEYPEIASQGGMIRHVQDQNAEWYRELVGLHTANRAKPRSRKVHDTLLKRRNIRDILANMLKRGYTNSFYGQDILNVAEKERVRNQEREDWEEQQAAAYRERTASREPGSDEEEDDWWDNVPDEDLEEAPF